MEECSSLMQNLMQIHCSTLSVILYVMATQYTCSLNSVCCPHWLAQWSHHCSCMHILVHSPWLPGYIDVIQTILVVLTITGLFPERPCVQPCGAASISPAGHQKPGLYTGPLVAASNPWQQAVEKLPFGIYWCSRAHRGRDSAMICPPVSIPEDHPSRPPRVCQTRCLPLRPDAPR